MLRRLTQYLHAEKDAQSMHPLRSIVLGGTVVFAPSMPIQSLAGVEAKVVGVRSYRFVQDVTETYTLRTPNQGIYHLTIAEDGQGLYLAIARELPRSQWGEWFDLDALDFFTTPSSARTLKLLPNAKAPIFWSAPRYQKMIDALEGQLQERTGAQESLRLQPITYTLLASEEGDKAIEIEQLNERGFVRLYATLYRPEDDIAQVLPPNTFDGEDVFASPAPQPMLSAGEPLEGITHSHAVDVTPQLQQISDAITAAQAPLPSQSELPSFVTAFASAQNAATPVPEKAPAPLPKQAVRPDFRRVNPVRKDGRDVMPEPLPLPSFLLDPKAAKKSSDANSASTTLAARESPQLRCNKTVARKLMDVSEKRGLTLPETLRGMLGLTLNMRDEVIFEIPLSDDDYKELAMRYHMKASHREEIRARMMQELVARIEAASSS
jgi:hypothetical protein